jgi:peptidyl-prolyl cis-trans isomerase D
MRDGAKSGLLKFFLLGLLVMAAGGLVLTDVGGFFRGGVSSNVVAKGDGIEIGIREFDRNVRRILARQGMSPQEAYRLGIIEQILNSEIQVRLMTREARRLGINVSDKTVTKQISKLAEPLATDGTSKTEALKQILRAQGISEGEFIMAIRQEMGNTLFRDAVLLGANTISRQQAEDLYLFKNEQRDFTGFILSNKSAEVIEKPTEENLRKYYEANKSDYASPETRSITIATLKKEMLADRVKITDEELKEIYNERIDTFKNPEKRKLQQAILSTQTDAQDVLKKVENGKALKDAVKDITGKTAGYIGENDFKQDGLLEEVSGPVFTAKEGEVIGPIQTALGWHAMKLIKIIEPETESFESAKEEIRDGILQERLIEDLIDTANMIDDRLAGGEKLDVIVQEVGLTTESFEDVNQAGTNQKGKDLFAGYQGDKARILEMAFDYLEGESSPVMELADGRFITVRVDSIKPLEYASFEEVKGKLETRWLNEQKTLVNRARAEEALMTIKNGASIADVAKNYNAGVKTYNNLKRNEPPAEPITFSTAQRIFVTDEAVPLKLEIENGYLIGAVSDIELPDLKNAGDEIDEIMENAGEVMPQEILSQYINALSERYNVRVNNNVLKAVYGVEPAAN